MKFQDLKYKKARPARQPVPEEKHESKRKKRSRNPGKDVYGPDDGEAVSVDSEPGNAGE